LKASTVHRLAKREIREAVSFYEHTDDPELADDFQDRLRTALLEVRQNPQRYSRWKETKARKHKVERFPYLIFYVDYPDRIRVLAVAHTSRRPGYWRTRIAVD
jgi:plasmid stabilization system protein ParE